MKNYYSLHFKSLLFALLFFVCHLSIGQTVTVFSEDFETNTSGNSYTTGNDVFIGNSNKWKLTRSGNDFGAKIFAGGLDITNNASWGGQRNGWGMGSVRSSFYSAPYTDMLKNNPGPVTWIFSIKQSDSNPSGFGNGNVGIAFILAGTVGTSNAVGQGYAITLGNSGSPDPIRLVRYNSGLASSSTLITSNTTGLTNFGDSYISVKVIYNPATDIWQLYLRNDGSNYANPKAGNLTLQNGSIANNTYTSSELPIMGGYYNTGTSTRYSFFEQIDVLVGVPLVTTMTPTQAFAGSAELDLIVNGQNFNANSKVLWNNIAVVTEYITPNQLKATIPQSYLANVGNYPIKVVNGTTSSNSVNFSVTSAGTPIISTTPESIVLPSSVFNMPSGTTSYAVSGINLTDNVTVTAPAQFEISLSSSSGFSSSLNLVRNPATLTLATQPSTIYVRKIENAPVQFYDEMIDHTTGGTSFVKQVNLKTVVLAAEPTSQSTDLLFSDITSNSFKLNLTSGNGNKRMIVVREDSAVNSLPIDGSHYASNAIFGGGAEIGTGNYVVYADGGNTLEVTGLLPEKEYYVSVVEYNGIINGTENYLTTGSILTGNVKTRKVAAGWQIYTINDINKIDFDSTVDGVNAGAFQGAGISPNGDFGDLNSSAWAISGLSSGDINFEGTSTENTDYDRGVSSGAVTEGGIYAFETSPANYSLGVHPTDADFTPGSITLRIQNQSDVEMTSLNIGYKVFVYNDQDASSGFNFSHSSNNSTYQAISEIDVTSYSTADIIPKWRGHFRSTTISGLAILPGDYYYLRWSGTDEGAVAYDEFALDDIVLVANPSTTFVPFESTAESFVLNGNVQLSGDLQVEDALTFNGGKLKIGANTLTIKGNVANISDEGIQGSGASNLNIIGTNDKTLSFDQSTYGTTNLFNSFSIASIGFATTTVENDFAVQSILNINPDQKLDLGIHSLSGGFTTATIDGTLFTQNTTSTFPGGIIWSGNGVVNYNSTAAAQTIASGTYTNLTISNPYGATLAGTITVNGILHLPQNNPSATLGSLDTGSYNIAMNGTSTNTGIGDVTGTIYRDEILPEVLYTFGHKNNSIIFQDAGILPTSMGLKIQLGTEPSWKPGAVKRLYDFTQTGGSGTKAVIKGSYLDSELNGNVESKLVDWARVTEPSTAILEQGKSNYDINENWIELTNVDVGNVFKSIFGKTELTFDASATEFSVWNGSLSSSWITAANWTPVGVPNDDTRVVIPSDVPNNPILTTPVVIKKITIEEGGVLTSPDDYKFTILGDNAAWINKGTFVPGGGSSEVIFGNANATIAGITEFNNITVVDTAGLSPLTGNIMRIAGIFDKAGYYNAGAVENTLHFTGTNQVIPELLLGILGYSNLIIDGEGTVFPESLSIVGNLTFNKPVDFTGKTIKLIGSRTQIVGGAVPPVFDDLEINNSDGGVSLASNMAVVGTLTLNSGHLTLNDKDLTLGSNSVAGTFSSASMIVTNGSGVVRRPFDLMDNYLFPIGDNNPIPTFSPITVKMTEGTFNNAFVAVSVKDAKHPNNNSTEDYLTRYWNVTQNGITAAVASITANYLPEDVSSNESAIVAAQLNGIFNQISNPWVKYNLVNGNSLEIENAPLIQNQTASFTGLKSGDFNAIITGFGSFCKNEAITLTAETTGGDGPFSYQWSNSLGDGATATPPSTDVATTSYDLTVRDANGLVSEDVAAVTILAPTVGGVVSANQLVCIGSKPNDFALTDEIGSVVYWQKSTDPTFTSEIFNIANSTDTLTSDEAGEVYQTTYFRAVVSNDSCADEFSAPSMAEVKSTTWNSGWSNGVPDGYTNVIIQANYNEDTDLEACSIVVENNSTITIKPGKTLTVNGTVYTSEGSLVIENNGSLLQSDDAARNVGAQFTAKRITQPMFRYDFTYWSSPVAGQTLNSLSPVTLFDKYFGWDANAQIWITYKYGTEIMQPGLGYSVRAPQNFSTTPANTSPYDGEFTGTPNNGNFSSPVVGGTDKYNLLGNPYPSAISADEFISSNINHLEGTLYFWTHNTAPATSNGYYYTYASADYASYNFMGGTGTEAAENSGINNNVPNGKIASGQGFFVKGSSDGFVSFNNSMRIAGDNNQFFKSPSSTNTDKSRIWINISNTNDSFRQMLVGYTGEATSGYDKGWDGELMSNSQLTIYTFIEEQRLGIQALPLPFNSNSVVPFGYTTDFSGSHRIALDQFDGLFENQNVYVVDKSLEITHDLKTAPYDFITAVGTFEDRFEIVYVNSTLNNPNFDLQNQLYVYKNKETIVVKSPSAEMKTIKIIDMQGRVLQNVTDLNVFETILPLNVSQQVLLISVTTKDNIVITKKLLY